MKRGRPLKYKTKEELQTAIDKYFKDCDGEMLKDADGQTIFDKFGQPVFIHVKPPTVTGLALALGFSTRLSLINYQGRKEFMNTITRAKSYIEAYAEGRLFDRDGVNGAKFSLSNNFKGWSEKQDTTVNMAVDDDPITASLKEELKK